MKKVITTLVLLFIFVLICIFVFIKLSEAPKDTLSKDFKEQALSKLLGRKAQLDTPQKVLGTTHYDGKFISFDYPKRAIIYKYRDPNQASLDSYLEEFIFDLKDPRITVDVQVLSNNGNIASIGENSGVSLRHSQPWSYTEEDIIVDGQKGKSFTKKDHGTEKTVFFLFHNRIYSLATTGSYFDDVVNYADEIIHTVNFKE